MSREPAHLSSPMTGPIGPTEREGGREMGRSGVQVGRSDTALGRFERAIRCSRCCRG